jgi:hypothetical protein
MRRKYLNNPTLFMHFYDYSPFEEDLNLHLNKFEFQSCKKCSIEIGQMFHFKRFFPIYKYKNSSPSCVPNLDPRGPQFVQAEICTISESFHKNMSYSGSVVLKEKLFL